MILGLLASSFAFADEGSEIASLIKAPVSDCEAPAVKASYGYYCVGIGPLPFPVPLVGVGGRFKISTMDLTALYKPPVWL